VANRHSSTWKGLVELIGLAPTRRLIRELPGERLYFPAILKDEERNAGALARLIALIGREHAYRLARVYRGDCLEIPTERSHERFLRNRAIVAAYSDGTRVPELCKRFGLSRRQIYEVLKQPVEADPETIT
jgi:Mor family transcriptional regulator